MLQNYSVFLFFPTWSQNAGLHFVKKKKRLHIEICYLFRYNRYALQHIYNTKHYSDETDLQEKYRTVRSFFFLLAYHTVPV